ncbi:hypothetical protein XH96_04170 [Bradyrhizobium sp. CCBAU 51765]|nr:hypothetical protein XH96_04170 [Bradyrhizobium sp. CCBAU 51765]
MALLSAGLPYEMVEVESAPRSSKMGEDCLKLPLGAEPCAGPRQRRDRDRRPGDCPEDRRQASAEALAPAHDSSERHKLKFPTSELRRSLGPPFAQDRRSDEDRDR